MKQICIFLVFVLLTSCGYFNAKKTSSEAILMEELQTFNWKDVDEYPTFSICDAALTKEERKDCFQHTLTSHITDYLLREEIVVNRDIKDTMMLQFQVSNLGELALLDIEIDSLTQHEIPEIKDILFKSLDSLPKIFPAIKRGQQVTTQFKLPIIINVN